MPSYTVDNQTFFYKCGWSLLEGQQFHSKVTHTFANGTLILKMVNSMKLKGERIFYSKD